MPKDLPETFNRVLQRLRQSKTSDPALCKKVFELVTAAQRPLSLEELRHAVSVVPGNTTWDTRQLINNVQRVVDCCGSFLIIDEEYSTVQFIHHSVKQYLLSSVADPILKHYHVDLMVADLNLGEICVTYLSLDVPGMQLSASRKDVQIKPQSISSAVVNTTLPQSSLSKKIALRLLRSEGNSNYDLQRHLESTMSLTQASRESMEQIYSFMSYAQENWLFHSRNFVADKGKSYTLWIRLINGEQGTRTPWSEEDWHDLGSNILQWTAKAQHGALLYEMICRSEDSEERAQDMIRFLQREKSNLTMTEESYHNALSVTAMTVLQPILNAQNKEWDCRAQLALVKLLMNKGADIKTGSRKYRTVLQLASSKGYEAVVELLLDQGVDFDAQGDFNCGTALQESSRKGHETVVRMLLDRGANIDAPGDGDDRISWGTALQQSSMNGHGTVVRLLLDRGADVNVRTGRDTTALHLASKEGHLAVVHLLLDRGADINAGNFSTALQESAKGGYEILVRLLLDRGADIDVSSFGCGNALQESAKNGHEAVVRLLLDRGAEISVRSGDEYPTALQESSRNGHEAIVQLLLDRGALINDPRETYGCGTALQESAKYGHEGIVRLLLDRGADVNLSSRLRDPALQEASRNGHEAIVQLLLDRGALINSSGTVQGCGTALQESAKYGHEGIVRLLLDRGADVNLSSRLRDPALQEASRNGHEAIVQLLLDRGALINSSGTVQGCGTALQESSKHGHEGVVRLLLDRGASMNKLDDSSGRGTPLQESSENGHEAVVRLLLDRGADISARSGATALQKSFENGHKAIVRLLLDRGADVDSSGMSNYSSPLQEPRSLQEAGVTRRRYIY